MTRIMLIVKVDDRSEILLVVWGCAKTYSEPIVGLVGSIGWSGCAEFEFCWIQVAVVKNFIDSLES
jgi:hypothetical protein